MAGAHVFGVRFYMAGSNWPTNPFQFRGKGTIEIGADFVTVRGSRHRSFRLPQRQEQRLRVVDIVNAWASGSDVWFDVLGVKEDLTVGFSTADAATADRIVALLPKRQTPAFAEAHAENEVFHDRIDYWTPSTPVIWFLLTMNIGMFALIWMTGRRFELALAGPLRQLLELRPGASLLVAWGSNYGPHTLGGEWWRLLSSIFLHGSSWHLAFNMLALWQVGQITERVFGSMRFAGLYLLSGLAGSLASVLWNPHVNSVGASGAIFGIIGGLLAFLGRENSGVPPTVVRDLRASVIPFLLFSLWMGFIYPHTDNAAHIGGLVGGWLAGHLLARSIHVPEQRA